MQMSYKGIGCTPDIIILIRIIYSKCSAEGLDEMIFFITVYKQEL